MTDCDRFAPRLADLLVGALEPTESQETLVHLEGCLTCGEKLADLSRLEESLASLARLPVAPRAGRSHGLLLAVVVVAAGLLLVVALRAKVRLGPRASEPRVLAGELTVLGRPLMGDRVPWNTPLTAAGKVTVSLRGALLEAGPTTTFALVGAREVRLRAGELALRVEPDPSELAVLTPLGTAASFQAEFAVYVPPSPEGAVMSLSRTTQVTAAAAVTVLVTSGVVLWRGTGDASAAPEVRLTAGDQAVARTGSLDITRPSSLADAAAAHSAAVSRLQQQNETLKGELARIQARAAELEHRLAVAPESSRSQGTTSGAAAATPATAASSKRPRISFASLSDVPELSTIDWHRAGEASRRTSDLIKDMLAKMNAGVPVPSEDNLKLVEENNKLVKVAMTLAGKLPTWATGNGEYTHPIVLANLEAEHLVSVSLPLSDDQITQIVGLGADYDVQWKAAQAAYTADTLLLDKTLDELQMKKAFCDRMNAVMTPDQQAALFDPATRDVLGVDLYSPMLMVITTCQPYGKASIPDLKKSISQSWLAALELDDTHKTDVDLATGTLLSQVTPPTVPVAQLRMVRIDEALAAGRANSAALKELLRPLANDAEAKTTIANIQFFYVPRLISKP